MTLSISKERDAKRRLFLDLYNLGEYHIKALIQDASFRRYYRVIDNDQSYILMDAPPEHEKVIPFINIAEHLSSLNLSAPKIYQFDIENGFILLEDFGDNTFTGLLRKGEDEKGLYRLAVETLTQLQAHPRSTDIEIGDYTIDSLINEALLLCDWYYNYQVDMAISDLRRESYIECWNQIFRRLPISDKTLVLRDYHVDNLIKLKDGKCGLLDFQDAVTGPAAYDLVSLLEDARRDVSKNLRQQILEYYFSFNHQINKVDFFRWYHVLGVQRHCKVLGIFTRLSVRDGKHHYLNHINRAERLLKSHLEHGDLEPLKSWLSDNKLKLAG